MKFRAHRLASKEKRPRSEDDFIHDDIFSAIIDRKIAPGTKLKEELLSEIYDVTRARIRKILTRLAHDRVVTLIANRGAFVYKPSVAEAIEVFAARRVNEVYLVRHLATKQDPQAVKLLKQFLKKEKKARSSDKFETHVQVGGGFHLQLADVANSPILANFVHELVARSALISATYESGMPASCEHDEHIEIVTCIENGQVDEAEGIMDQHLQGILSRMNFASSRTEIIDLYDVLSGLR